MKFKYRVRNFLIAFGCLVLLVLYFMQPHDTSNTFLILALFGVVFGLIAVIAVVLTFVHLFVQHEGELEHPRLYQASSKFDHPYYVIRRKIMTTIGVAFYISAT